jgi:hypothetical protein
MSHLARPGQDFCKKCGLKKKVWNAEQCKGNQLVLNLNKKPPVALDLLNGDKPKIAVIRIRLKTGNRYSEMDPSELVGMRYKGFRVTRVDDIFPAGSTEFYRELVLKK